jgi:protein TonB
VWKVLENGYQRIFSTQSWPQSNGVEGKVIVQFIVDQHGEVTDVVILKGIDPTLDKEAIRVIKSSPRWSPGIQNGKIVRARYIIPVSFILQ